MRETLLIVALFVLVSGSAACRQADGQMPERSASTRQDDIDDIGKDIANVMAQRQSAQEELDEDLHKFVQTPEAEPHVTELARRLSAVLPGVTLNESETQQLAEKLWQSISSKDLSERQARALQDQARDLLVYAGLPENEGMLVVAPLADIQLATTERERRWYEVF